MGKIIGKVLLGVTGTTLVWLSGYFIGRGDQCKKDNAFICEIHDDLLKIVKDHDIVLDNEETEDQD